MSDVTKRTSVRIAAALAVLVIVISLASTLLRPPPAGPGFRVPLADRVPGAVVPVAASAVLPDLPTDAPEPTASGLQSVLKPLVYAKALGDGVSVDVLDPATGEHLLSRDQDTARTPASTAKLLTTAAALTLLGPDATLPTTVVSGADPGDVVLVGGGDVMLSAGAGKPDAVNGRAGLADLATQTASALRAQGRTEIQLTFDDELFSGPTRSPKWSPGDVGDGYVAPIQALEVDAGRVAAGHYAQRSSDPALRAAQTFAGLLEKRDIDVTGSVTRGPAPESASGEASVLGRVQSAPITALVEYALTESDNTVAEALGHLVAIAAGHPGSFAEAGPAVLAEVSQLGVPVTGAVMTDTSGLGDGTRLPPTALTGLLAVATGDEQPQLRPILSGMPVAAVSGTLVDRFSGSGEQAASGVVRAKTGSLTGVSSLAGTVVDSDGRLLVFAALADKVTLTASARAALDRLASAIAACGCR